MRNATWILVVATGVFAYVAVMDSINSGSIITNLKGLGLLVIGLGILYVALGIAWDLFKFVFKFVKTQLQ